ncbi:MAG: 5'-methylthioadenosine nucleosidase [Firmicutes bacterium CAG:137_57_8]|nr:MAG: 5'-methylthioadenosine nucleosidase [Firmicutes bacterium CAG:137_57_8]
MKKIGMIVAVEMKAVLERYGTPQEEKEYPGYRVLVYEAEDYIIYALNCGAGEIAAAAATQFLISQMQVDFIVNFGVVGGLTEEMTKTKMCVVESVVHYDFDTTEVDAVEVEKAENLQPDLKRVVCASGDKFIGNPEKKKEMHRVFGADICEMEAAGIVLTSNRNRVPCLLIKIVSDSVSGGAEEFRRELEHAAQICLDTVDQIIRKL